MIDGFAGEGDSSGAHSVPVTVTHWNLVPVPIDTSVVDLEDYARLGTVRVPGHTPVLSPFRSKEIVE